MPLFNGLDAVGQLKKEGTKSRVILLTMHADTSRAAEAFRAGACGYPHKNSAGEELVAAIDQLLMGRASVTPLIAKDLASILIDVRNLWSSINGKLMARQREVLRLIAEGRTMKAIATFCISLPKQPGRTNTR
jgi:DNA-binding NarL/FixJ family response regulator